MKLAVYWLIADIFEVHIKLEKYREYKLRKLYEYILVGHINSNGSVWVYIALDIGIVQGSLN